MVILRPFCTLRVPMHSKWFLWTAMDMIYNIVLSLTELNEIHPGVACILGKQFQKKNLMSLQPKWECLNKPIFWNLGLFAAFWACFMCHHELWPTSVSHPFSSLNSFLGFAGGKHYQKITIPIFRLVLQNFAIPGYFPYILFYRYPFSLLSSGWFVIAVCGSISFREVVKH